MEMETDILVINSFNLKIKRRLQASQLELRSGLATCSIRMDYQMQMPSLTLALNQALDLQ